MKNTRLVMLGLAAISRINGIISKIRTTQKSAKAGGLPTGVDSVLLTFVNVSSHCYCNYCGSNKTHTSVFHYAWHK